MSVPLRTRAQRETDGASRRSRYRQRPCTDPDLRRLVSARWVGTPGWPRVLRLLPDGCADIVWDGANLTATPATAGPLVVELTDRRARAGVRLRPGVAGALLGPALPAADGRTFALEDLFGDVARRAVDDLARSDSPAEHDRVLRALVRDSARRGAAPDAVALAAIRLLSRPGARIGAVADQLGISPRALRRRVVAAAGIGPKQLQRVLRFTGVHSRLADLAAARTTLATLAAELGYSDQSHLSAECRRLSGSSPGTLSRAWAGSASGISVS